MNYLTAPNHQMKLTLIDRTEPIWIYKLSPLEADRLAQEVIAAGPGEFVSLPPSEGSSWVRADRIAAMEITPPLPPLPTVLGD